MQNQGLRELTANLYFDYKLKEKANIIQTDEAKFNYDFQIKYLDKINAASLLIYYFLIPLTQAPGWCVRYYSKTNNFFQGMTYQCGDIYGEDGGLIPCTSGMKLSPATSSILDIICLLYFLFHMWFKRTWRVQSTRGNYRFYSMIVIFLVCVGDTIYCFLK